MSQFELHPQLEKDSHPVYELSLCAVRLINDAHYPWLILVPKFANVFEIIDLSDAQQQLLWQESAMVSRALTHLFTPDKLNVAALGNMVPQLHIHHIVRFTHDVSWPKPVWGQVAAKPYSIKDLSDRATQIRDAIHLRRNP